jgi:hypothetical protein
MAKAGAEGYTQRWGVYTELRRAAQLRPILEALYGPKRDVTLYPAWVVLKEMAASTDEQRLQDIASEIMRKAK